jgi:hypothetical protein
MANKRRLAGERQALVRPTFMTPNILYVKGVDIGEKRARLLPVAMAIVANIRWRDPVP